jgi:hypothetical protein
MTDASTIERVPGVVAADVAELRVLLNNDLHYLGLDAIGARVWELLDTTRSLGEVVSLLTQEYDVSAEECRADVVPFLETLERHRLVDIH